MNLLSKKKLAAKTLNIGIGRIYLDENRREEIKEAITRQDIKDLVESGAISIKEIKGQKKNVKRNNRRRAGKRKIKVNTRKQDYVKITRKLRSYVNELKKQGLIDNEKYKEIRKNIRNKLFKSKRQLKESLE